MSAEIPEQTAADSVNIATLKKSARPSRSAANIVRRSSKAAITAPEVFANLIMVLNR